MIPSTTARSAILGVPLDPNKQPSGSGVVRAFEQMDARIIANSAGAIIKNSLASLNSTATPDAGLMAWVMGDATVSNNGVYENTGTSESPAWTRRGALPYAYIHGINVGAGTADAIEITTAIPVPEEDGAAEILVPIETTNTSTTVTLSINGEDALPVKTLAGSDPQIGGLVGFMKVIKLNSQYRMMSDQASAAIQAAAEAAQSYAEEWAQSDDPISVAAGGDAATDRSAKYWADLASTTFESNAANVIPSLQQFAVGGATQEADLGNTELTAAAIRVFIDGVYQFAATWEINDGVIEPVGGTWPGDGVTTNMEVIIDATTSIAFNTPSNGSVTAAKLESTLASRVAGSMPTLTLAELQAGDSGAIAAGSAFVTDIGRSGALVKWSADDLSDYVTADTSADWYIPPDSDNTGASGAWIVSGLRFEDEDTASAGATFQPPDVGFTGDWALTDKTPYKQMTISRGAFLVTPSPGTIYNDFGGLLPAFHVVPFKHGIGDGNGPALNWNGAPHTAMRGELYMSEHDDALGITARRFDTDTGDEDGTIISSPGGVPIFREFSQLYKNYVLRRVRVATTANLASPTAMKAGDVIDGVTLVAGNDVLVRAQSSQATNGVYTVGASNSARAAYANSWNNHVGLVVGVYEGSTLGQSVYKAKVTTGGTLGSTGIIFDAESVSYSVDSASGSDTEFGYYHPWTGANMRLVEENQRAYDGYGQGEKTFALAIPDGLGTMLDAVRFRPPTFTGSQYGAAAETPIMIGMKNAAGDGWQLLRVKADTVASLSGTDRVLYIDNAS